MRDTMLAVLRAPLGAVVVLAAACGGGSGSSASGGSSGTGSTGLTSAGTTSTTAGTSASTSTGFPGTSGTSGTTGGGGQCVTLCGGDCCSDAEECVTGTCSPVCESAIRCGTDLSMCCQPGELCLGSSCVAPGNDCLDATDCAAGEYCELTSGKCFPQQSGVCELAPPSGPFAAEMEWANYKHRILTIPVVADVDADGLPEVIISTSFDGTGTLKEGFMLVLAGESGVPQAFADDTPPTSFGSYGRATIGTADVSGDGVPDIVYAGRPTDDGVGPMNVSIIHAVDGQLKHLWASHAPGGDSAMGDYPLQVRSGAPAFANLDDDDASEIIWGAAIIDDDGTVVWDQGGSGAGGVVGGPSTFPGSISAVADLTGDGYPEIVSGQDAWSISWTSGTPPTVSLTNLWNVPVAEDGFPAVADLDQNGTPEVLLVANGELRALDGATGMLWCGVDPTGATCTGNDPARTQPLALEGAGLGGPPTVADYDGDGRPEVAVASGTAFGIYDFNRSGEDIVQPNGDTPPDPGAIYRRWSTVIDDAGSNTTGSSAYDFQGDGAVEALFGDQCDVWIYDGATGNVLADIPTSNETVHEYPVVADVDGDGHAEVLFVANDTSITSYCSMPTRGIYVYGGPSGQWTGTRPVWNQHAYHVSNSDSRGNAVTQETDNWTVPGLNDYRENPVRVGALYGADLTVDLSAGLGLCVDQELRIFVTVRNQGTASAPAGIAVNLYQGADASGTLLGMETTLDPLPPGGFTVFSWPVSAPSGMPVAFYATVDEPGTLSECNEDNNDALLDMVSCPAS